MSSENIAPKPDHLPDPLNQHPVDGNDPQHSAPKPAAAATSTTPARDDENRWDDLRDEANDLWEKIKAKSEAGWNSSRDALDDAGDYTRQHWNNFVNETNEFWNHAKTEGGEFREEAKEKLSDWRDKARSWWDKVQDQFDGDDKAHEAQKPPPANPFNNEDIPPAGAW